MSVRDCVRVAELRKGNRRPASGWSKSTSEAATETRPPDPSPRQPQHRQDFQGSRLSDHATGTRLELRTNIERASTVAQLVRLRPRRGRKKVVQMRQRLAILSVLFGTVLLGPFPLTGQPDWALDEDRRGGFIIGLGVGPSYTNISAGGQGFSKIGVATDLRIGAQVGPRAQVYYLNKVSFFGGGDLGGAELIASGLSGVGGSYLPSPQVHVSAGFGLGVWTELSADGDTESSTGLGLTGGVGYEFSDRWFVQGNLSYLRPDLFGQTVGVFQIGVNIAILSH